MPAAALDRMRSIGLPRLSVLACVLVATVVAAVRLPSVLADLDRTARDNARLSFADREIGGGNSVLPSQEIVYQARARVPEDGAYEVLLGPPTDEWTPLTAEHAAGFARYFLLPRRQLPGAEWVLCLNCDRSAAAGTVVWEGEDGLSIVRRE